VVGHNPSAIKMEVEAANAFVQAVLGGRIEQMVAALVTVGDVNVMGHKDNATGTALYHASWNGKLEAVRWLLAQEGIDVNLGGQLGTSPLIMASLRGHEAAVEALITAGADVDRQNCWGYTALMQASLFGHTAIVRRLIEAGARVNRTDRNGWTAIDCAQRHRRPATVEVLLAHRAMPGTGTWATTLPSLHTRLLGPTDAPFTLSPEEALPGVLSGTDVFGRTALHYAALTGDRAAYAVLCSAMREAGVDTEGVDGGGYTAFDHMVCGCLLYGIFGLRDSRHPQGFTLWTCRCSILHVLTAIGQVS
jgi:ankyrin repeat protein